MKKLLMFLLIPIFAVSLAFTEEKVNVQQNTKNAGESTKIKNREKTRLRLNKQNMLKQRKQVRQQTRVNTGTKAGK